MFSITSSFLNLGRGDAYVKQIFDTVASKYDFMNDVLSVGVHRLWKRHFVNDVVRPEPQMKYIDVAGGTGDIAFLIRENLLKQAAVKSGVGISAGMRNRMVNETPFSKMNNDINDEYSSMRGKQYGDITVLDINEKMLQVGQERALKMGKPYQTDMSWIRASGEELPFPSATFDKYTIAFGIRNVTHREKCIQEACRVLKVGGSFHVMEFSKVTNPVLSPLYNFWSDHVMVNLGKVLSDEESYQYLVDSIKAFPPQEEFTNMIKDGGFSYVTYENLSGGIAAIHTGVKTDERYKKFYPGGEGKQEEEAPMPGG